MASGGAKIRFLGRILSCFLPFFYVPSGPFGRRYARPWAVARPPVGGCTSARGRACLRPKGVPMCLSVPWDLLNFAGFDPQTINIRYVYVQETRLPHVHVLPCRPAGGGRALRHGARLPERPPPPWRLLGRPPLPLHRPDPRLALRLPVVPAGRGPALEHHLHLPAHAARRLPAGRGPRAGARACGAVPPRVHGQPPRRAALAERGLAAAAGRHPAGGRAAGGGPPAVPASLRPAWHPVRGRGLPAALRPAC